MPIPDPLFQDPYSTVLESRDGQLLGARIAQDGQWRFPSDPEDSLPERYVNCLLAFEDRYFYRHPGVNPFAIARAAVQNIESGRIVRGGSTITMQVARMARKNKSRTIWQKTTEIWLSLRLEFRYTKEQILRLYADHAPFGGNVVGLTTASWRYYGRSPHELSWAETANLTVLPNAPSLIFPGKNNDLLRAKRNGLLRRLLDRDVIDQSEFRLAVLEPLPQNPKPLPRIARHLLDKTIVDGHGQKRVRSSIRLELQHAVNNILDQHHFNYQSKNIHNAAALVIDIASGESLAYVGNVGDAGFHGQAVDLIQSRRSPGSLLKPFLYAMAIDNGIITPHQLLSDIPIRHKGFAPQNFDKRFQGAVPARFALRSSLNVPFVNLLKDYGYQQLYHDLKRLGISTLDNNAEHYGLTMILGGGEVTLWEVTSAYASMVRSLGRYNSSKGQFRYNDLDYRSNTYMTVMGKNVRSNADDGLVDAAAIWHTLKAMQDLRRPDAESNWKRFGSSQSIAWKTGTSYGHKDAWAVGVNDRYVVGVWVGNADGEGRPDLTGVIAASPVMFRIFENLDGEANFERPVAAMAPFKVCLQSGFRANQYCPDTETQFLSKTTISSATCPYHRMLHLDQTRAYQVNSACYPVDKMVQVPWFVLSPAQAWYFKEVNPFYSQPPPYLQACLTPSKGSRMEMIYPKQSTRVYIPREIDGTSGRVIFEVAHEDSKAKIYWHLNEDFVGVTERDEHKLALAPESGNHTITLVDEDGQEIAIRFEVMERTN